MKISEYIKLKYDEIRPQFDEHLKVNPELGYLELKHQNYTHTVAWIGKFLNDTLSFKDNESALKSFESVLKSLLINCMLDKVKPQFKTIPFGFTHSDYCQDSYYILQFLEGYIKAQIPKKDVYWWIELGIRLSVVEFDKE